MDISAIKKSRLCHLLVAVTFFTSGIIINIVQCILYLTLRQYDKMLYRRINWYFDYSIYSQLVFMGDWWSKCGLKIYIDKEEYDKYYGKEHAYCIMNHTYEIDWLMGWMICDRIKLLGNVKCYCKKAIQFLPVLGWAWKFSEFVFLERSFEKDKENINRQVKNLAEHPDPMWLLMFPEGTRFTKEKSAASIEFARKNNLKELKHHLLPRTKGFIASLPSMEGKVPAIYDCTLSFKEDDVIKPTIPNLLDGKPVTGHLYIRRVPFDQVPKTPEGQDRFLKEMFERKDKLRESFMKTGDFFKLSGYESERVEPFEQNRRPYSLINQIFWTTITLIPIVYYLASWLLSGAWISFLIGVGMIGLVAVLLDKSIGMSEIKKSSSSYGTNSPKKAN